MKNNLHCQLIREQVNDPLKEIIGLGMTAEENREHVQLNNWNVNYKKKTSIYSLNT